MSYTINDHMNHDYTMIGTTNDLTRLPQTRSAFSFNSYDLHHLGSDSPKLAAIYMYIYIYNFFDHLFPSMKTIHPASSSPRFDKIPSTPGILVDIKYCLSSRGHVTSFQVHPIEGIHSSILQDSLMACWLHNFVGQISLKGKKNNKTSWWNMNPWLNSLLQKS